MSVKIISWMYANSNWIFSGVGVLLLSWVGALVTKKRASGISQMQRSGSNSTNVQVAGDVRIKNKKK